jgi:dTDP-glucose 4,6-dehydratase
MRVLLTGSAGFIGSHIVEHILENTDWEVIGLDSFRHRGDPCRVPHLDSNRYRVFAADVSAPLGRLEKSIGEIDFLINCASESHVDRSITDPVPFVENNVSLTLQMLEYARRVKPKVFIQISTDEVYGPALGDSQHSEWSPILPSNPYAASKAAQEAIAISYWRTYGVPVVITNTMNNFGERQDPEKFIPMCISKIAKNETVPIHTGPDGNPGSRFYLHARNHADALLYILSADDNGLKRCGVYPEDERPWRFNVVGDVEVNNLKLAHMIAEAMRKPFRCELVDFHATRPGHDSRYALDGSQLASWGWKAPVDFEESLLRTVEWTQAHNEWLEPLAVA